jgi:hypothetical protein
MSSYVIRAGRRENTKIIYVYDFINMWTFLVELAAVEDQVAGNLYPETLFSWRNA